MRRQTNILTLFLLVWIQTFCFAQTKDLDRQAPTFINVEPCFVGVDGEVPEFPGGRDSLTKFLQRNIKYPSNWKGKGTVGIKFTVDTTGTLKDIEVLKQLCEECDREVLRVIKLMPTWKPRLDARTKRPVETTVNLPIIFRTKE
jgi:protein TonB